MKIIEFWNRENMDVKTTVKYLISVDAEYFVYEMQANFRFLKVDNPVFGLLNRKNLDENRFVVTMEDLGDIVITKDIDWENVIYRFPHEEARRNRRFISTLESSKDVFCGRILNIPDGTRYSIIYDIFDDSESIYTEDELNWLTAKPNTK